LKINPADRISEFKPYFFAQLNNRIEELKRQGVDVIRLDMGSPDLPPDDHIIDSLINSARRSDTHGYSTMGGTPAFKKAVAEYYLRRYGVSLDSKKEILALIGSKEGIFNLSQVILNPGDHAMIPDPGYPVYRSSAIIAGAIPYSVPLLRINGYLPKFEDIPTEIAQASKILWLNYPNNPTGASASLTFFQKAVEFASNFSILIAHDAPYMEVTFDGSLAHSLLQVPGSKENCVEFNSLSKTYNMAGWRLGMAVGNPDVLQLLHTFKSQVDSSQFLPVIEAGVTALTGDQEWILGRNEIYRERRDIVVRGLKKTKMVVDTPSAGLYVWFATPSRFGSCAAFCETLLNETGVSITPGSVYGNFGEGFARISLVTETTRMSEAMNRLVNWLN
jgi:LL-diaminopimelate aminotransferase